MVVTLENGGSTSSAGGTGYVIGERGVLVLDSTRTAVDADAATDSSICGVFGVRSLMTMSLMIQFHDNYIDNSH